MILNTIEKALMNNPVRALVQRHHEAAMMLRLGGRVEGMKALEIGCGRGVGTEIIFEQFGAQEVHACDLDPQMIGLAQRRLAKYPPARLRLFVGDAETIDAPDAAFDAVFDFAIIHHIPVWQNAIKEIARVLKPNGRFYFEEVTKQALDRWFYRTFLKHPAENRFTGAQFVAGLETHGIRVGDKQTHWFLNDLIVGVGRKIC